MKEDYSSFIELPDRKQYKINQKLTYHNQLKTKLKLKDSDKITGIDHIPPNHIAEFTKTKKGWKGEIKKNS